MSHELDQTTLDKVREIYNAVADIYGKQTDSFLTKQSNEEELPDQDKLKQDRDWKELQRTLWTSKEKFKAAHETLQAKHDSKKIGEMIKQLTTVISCLNRLKQVAEEKRAQKMTNEYQELIPPLTNQLEELEKLEK